MADLSILLTLDYAGSGYYPCNKVYFDKGNGCCPLTLYLLQAGSIRPGDDHLKILAAALSVFNKAAVYGYLDGFDGRTPQTQNNWGHEYSQGFGIGKQALLRYFRNV